MNTVERIFAITFMILVAAKNQANIQKSPPL